MKHTILSLALFAAFGATAQTQSPYIGGNGNLDQQVIGDTSNSADHTASTANQLGNAANANGATITVPTDIRTQISPNMDSTATGGAAIGNQSDNKSNAYNGPQTMGQVTNGNSAIGNTSSYSGGNVLGGATSGPVTGTNTNTLDAKGGAGGQGGSASNLGINGQQQGIDGSGNSTNSLKGGDQRNGQGQTSDNRNTLANGQQQANTGTNAQGQKQANLGINGQSSVNALAQDASTRSGVSGSGNSTGAGANNRTANTTRVDASDRSLTTNTYTAKTTVWAPVVHGPGAAPLPGANVTVIGGSCGPIKYIVSTPVIGKRFGVWGGQQDVEQGLSDRAEVPVDRDGRPIPDYKEFIQRGQSMYGVKVIRALAVVGTSTAASLSIGGFGKDGQGGQGGGAASGQLQQIAVHAWTEECEAYRLVPEAVEPPPPVFFTPAPQCEPAPVFKRKAIRRKPAPLCK